MCGMRILCFAALLCVPALAGDLEESLKAADRAFDKATLERGLDGWMSWFAADAQVNSPEGMLKGKAALRGFYAKMFARKEFSIRWQPLHAEASKDGTLGYTLGSAEISFRDEKGVLQKRPGRYLTVWRRQPDGGWKVISDIGN
jgi:ketosteroid isomerase-like protein